jgi:hypothetical protein
MTESMSIEQIAKTVTACYPGPSEIEYLHNPRVEQESHYYNVAHTGGTDVVHPLGRHTRPGASAASGSKDPANTRTANATVAVHLR